MINNLKVGQVAEASDMEMGSVTKTPNGEIVWTEETRKRRQWDIPSLNCAFMNAKWRILPRYTSFEEAMKALKDGKKVTYHDRSWSTTFNNEMSIESTGLESFNFLDLFEGKWSIKD